MDILFRFIYTFKEYLRFSGEQKEVHELLDEFDDKLYLEVNYSSLQHAVLGVRVFLGRVLR